MEELYSETYLQAKPGKKRQLARGALIVLASFVLAIGILAMLWTGTFLVFMVMAIVAVVILVLLPTNKIAYEYIFVDGQIDFDRILKGEKRKTMQRIDMERVELVAPENSPVLDSKKHLAVTDYSSGMPADKHYIAVFLGEKGTELIRFTPDEKMLHMIKMKGPSKLKLQ